MGMTTERWEKRRENGFGAAWNKGKKGSQVAWNKGRSHCPGEKNYFWKGGGWAYQRSQVLIRDNHTCQKCSFREVGIMQVDHILPKAYYPELIADQNNLLTLCPNCHARKTNQDKIQYKHLSKRSNKQS